MLLYSVACGTHFGKQINVWVCFVVFGFTCSTTFFKPLHSVGIYFLVLQSKTTFCFSDEENVGAQHENGQVDSLPRKRLIQRSSETSRS